MVRLSAHGIQLKSGAMPRTRVRCSYSSFASVEKNQWSSHLQGGRKVAWSLHGPQTAAVPTLAKHLALANQVADAGDHGLAIVSVDPNGVAASKNCLTATSFSTFRGGPKPSRARPRWRSRTLSVKPRKRC